MSPELEHIRREVERLTRDWSEAEWYRAQPGEWSCGQILEHLLLGYIRTTEGVLDAMEVGRPLGRKPTVRDRVRTLWVTKLGFPSPEEISPKEILPNEGLQRESLRHFYDALVALDATLAEAERRFGRRVKLLDDAILGPLSAAEWRRLHRNHAKRHLKELARRVRRAQLRLPDREFSH